MKNRPKIFILGLVVLIISIVFITPVCAADDCWRMTHGDDSQDALLVGKVTEVTDDYILFDVVRTVNGTPAYSPFKLIRENNQSIKHKQFSINDGILVSVRFSDISKSVGTVVYGVYKVALMQDKKIKMDLNDYDVGYIEWPVNTGLADSLYGEFNKVFTYTGNGRELLFDGTKWYKDSLDPKYKAPEVKMTDVKTIVRHGPTLLSILFITIFIFTSIFIFSVIFIFVLKKTRKHKQI